MLYLIGITAISTLIPRYGYVISTFVLATTYLFTYAIISPQQGGFYALMSVLILVAVLFGFFIEQKTGVIVLSQKFTGLGAFIVTLTVGGVITLVMLKLSGGRDAASVLGVPNALAVSGSFSSALAPMLISALGFIENRFFYSIASVSMLLLTFTPLAGLAGFAFTFLPVVVGAGLFALFHLAVFQVGGLFFAFTVFVLWMLVARSPLGPEPTNVSHYLWNGSVALPRAAAVVS